MKSRSTRGRLIPEGISPTANTPPAPEDVVKRYFNSLGAAAESPIGTRGTSPNVNGSSVVEQQPATVDLPEDLEERLRAQPDPFIAGFYSVSEWDGYVSAIRSEVFEAVITEVSVGTAETMQAEFPLEDLANSERAALRPGQLFRWSVGYEITREGTRSRVSRILMRKLPELDEAESRKLFRESAARAEKLRWEE